MRILSKCGKLVLKVMFFPLTCILCLVKWLLRFAVSLSAWIFYLLAVVFTLTGILSFCFGLEPVSVMIEMICAGFVFYLVPHVGDWCVDRITALQISIHNLLAQCYLEKENREADHPYFNLMMWIIQKETPSISKALSTVLFYSCTPPIQRAGILNLKPAQSIS